jgi:hypothetical protein
VGVLRTGRGDRKAAVKLRDQQAARQGIRRGARLHAGQPQLFDPAVLGRVKEPLDAPLGLGTACQDQPDAQLLQRAAELRQAIGIPTALAVVLEDAVAIGVQGHRPAVAPEPLAEQVEVGLDGLAGVEAGQDPAGGVVDQVDQDHRLPAALGPVVDRGVHLHQLSEAPPARPPAAMGVAALARLPEPFLDEPTAQGLRAEMESARGELLASERGTEVVVVRAIGVQDPTAELGLVAMIGGAAAQGVDHGLVAFRLELAQQAPHVSWGNAEEPGGLDLRPLPLQNRR